MRAQTMLLVVVGYIGVLSSGCGGVSPGDSGRTSRRGGARLRCVLAGSAGAAVWAVQEPLDQWVLRSHYSDVAVLGKVAIGGRAWWPAGLALHLVNGAVFGLVYYEARRRRPQRPRRLAMSMALGEHVALYPLSYFVDRFHPRRGREEFRRFWKTRERSRKRPGGTPFSAWC